MNIKIAYENSLKMKILNEYFIIKYLKTLTIKYHLTPYVSKLCCQISNRKLCFNVETFFTLFEMVVVTSLPKSIIH